MGDSIIKEKKNSNYIDIVFFKKQNKKINSRTLYFSNYYEIRKKLILKRIGKYFNSHIEFYFLKKLKK